jgi:threonylcarbamoyladenosine tRNA methylthiotransferase CDKAL1
LLNYLLVLQFWKIIFRQVLPSKMSCDIIEDIEDILKQDKSEVIGEIIDEFSRVSNKSYILPKVVKKSKLESLANTFDQNDLRNEDEQKLNSESNIPGVASIYVKTWGCTHNSSDSEYMAGQLAAYGYKITENELDADLWLLNSCTVKNPAEDHFK